MKHRADTLDQVMEMRSCRTAIALPAGPSASAASPTLTPSGRHVRPPLPAPQIPTKVSWRSRRAGRLVLTGVAALSLVAAMPTAAYLFWQAPTQERMQVMVGMMTLELGLSMLLAARRPLEATLLGSLLTVEDRGVCETFDLADALQRVELSAEPDDRGWTLTLGRADAGDLVLRRNDVDATQLDPIVRYHRDVAERRLDRQWAMLGL
jgi:hypothetical protein